MEPIKAFFKRLFCKHTDADLLRWHWTHGPSGNEPLFVEAEYRCKDCGKSVYVYLHWKEAIDWAKAMGDHKRA